MALKLRRKRKLGLAALLAVMALAACDTQPATNVTSDAATLNSKGACGSGAYGGTNQYQLRKITDTGGGASAFSDVGPRFRFDCNGATGEVALNSHRQGGLAEGNVYEFRLVSRLDNGSVQTWDANGTNGGGAFDSFYTPIDLSNTTEEQSAAWATNDPDTGMPLATAAGNCGRPLEVKRDATQKSKVGLNLWDTHLMAPYKYCNGQITRMYAADASSRLTNVAVTLGWHKDAPEKVRAYSSGGNPEHAIYTYRFHFYRIIPIKNVGVQIQQKDWCSTLQVSGSGAWFTHGGCEPRSWSGVFN
jgi:hypothetical protein